MDQDKRKIRNKKQLDYYYKNKQVYKNYQENNKKVQHLGLGSELHLFNIQYGKFVINFD